MIKNISNLLLWGGALAGGGSGGGDTPSGGEEWIGDGNTHIWISLPEGRTSPMLGVCPNGTVTVDWGDGTTPDVLTGTSTSTVKFTPNHEYAKAGDYVITLTVDGTMAIKGGTYSQLLCMTSSTNQRDIAYTNSIIRVEIGQNVTQLNSRAFASCSSLKSVVIPEGVQTLGSNAFSDCFSLDTLVIPKGITTIPMNCFYYCYSLRSVILPEGVTTISSNVFSDCKSLTTVNIPNGVTNISSGVFGNCYGLASITIPNSVTSIGGTVFSYCSSLGKIRFENTTPPTVSNSSAFSSIPTDCIISVPVGSLSAYTTATNYPDPAKYTYVEE